MALRFKIATTLAHEFAVSLRSLSFPRNIIKANINQYACRRTITNSLQDGEAMNNIEPYFEDEPLSELGYSFMDKVNPLPAFPNSSRNSNT